MQTQPRRHPPDAEPEPDTEEYLVPMRAFPPLGWNRWRSKSSIIEQYSDESIMTTEMRRLARNLRYAAYARRGRAQAGQIPQIQTVIFTSAQADEGKSFVTAMLGVTVAQDEPHTKVLVLDGDLRHATQHELFQRSRAPGLSNVLQEDYPLGEAILPTEIPNLFLLPAGDVEGVSPERLLAIPATRDMLEACREFFDLILIDAPPIIPVNDAAILAPHTDGVVLVVMAKQTMRGDIEHAIELVKVSQAELLGVVVNKVKQFHHRYGYYAKESNVA